MHPPVTGPELRRAAIVEKVNAEGAVRTDELAESFGVSAMTVHRDLELLDRLGALRRVRGGARAVTGEVTEADVAQRRRRNAATKRALAQAASELIESGGVLALDDSTTVEALGLFLHALNPACVITHSLAQMQALSASQPRMPLIGLGGRFVPATGSFLGSATVRQAEGLSADVAVVSTTSVRGDSLYHPDEDAALTKQALIQSGRTRILICDSSKFGAAGLHFVARLDDFDDIVVEDGLPAWAADALAASGARVHRVPVPD